LVSDHRRLKRNYNIFRWYRAGWGRYTQADPLSSTGPVPDLYTYGAANPLRYYDPTGLVTVNQTFTRRGSLFDISGGQYSLDYSRISTEGTCACVGGSYRIRLTLNFDHGYLCTGDRACAREDYHAGIAEVFVNRAAREWTEYERVDYRNKTQRLADAQFWAEDLARHILDPSRWPSGLPRQYIERASQL
jgi:RHS repeat-associated protein